MKLVKVFALSVLLSAGWNSAATAQSGNLTDKLKSEELTAFWAESLFTLLSFGCDFLTCEPVDVSAGESFEYSIADITFDLRDFDFEFLSDATDSLVVDVNRVTVVVDRKGISSFNGFPNAISIEIADVSMGQGLALHLAGLLNRDSKIAQRMIALELAREGLTVKAATAKDGDFADLLVSLELRSQDRISVGARVWAPDATFKATVKSPIDIGEIDTLDPTSRGLLMWQSIDWWKALEVPTSTVQLEFEEFALLDKLYVPNLRARGSEGDTEFWKALKGAIHPEAPDVLRGFAREMIGFFSSWRLKGHLGTFKIIPLVEFDDVIAESTQVQLSGSSQSCRITSGVWIFIAGVLGGLPYLIEEDDDPSDYVASPYWFLTQFWNQDDDFQNLMDLSRCKQMAFSFEWEEAT